MNGRIIIPHHIPMTRIHCNSPMILSLILLYLDYLLAELLLAVGAVIVAADTEKVHLTLRAMEVGV